MRCVEDSHPEADRAPSDRLPDLAPSDDTQRRSVDIPSEHQARGPGLPASRSYETITLGYAACRRHQQGKGEVGGSLSEDAWGMADGNSRLGSRGEINIVQPNSEIADDLKPRELFNRSCVEAIGDHTDDRVGISASCDQIGMRRGRIIVPQINTRRFGESPQWSVGNGAGHKNTSGHNKAVILRKMGAALLYARIVEDKIVSDKNADQLISAAVASGRRELSEIESKRVLSAAGVSVSVPEAAGSADEAAAIAARKGYPVVLKVLSPEVSHKSEVGGVALGIASDDAVREAFDRIRKNLAEKAPAAPFEGVAVDTMARPGVELILGIIRDDRFGPLVIAGLGGVFVEVFKDTTFRLAPIDRREARAMLEELRGAAILRGARGAKAIDFDAVADLLMKLGEFAAAHSNIKELDLNPVVAYDNGLAVLDARILLDEGANAAQADPNHAARLENLKRAIKARSVVVIGDKRVGGYLWLRAMRKLTGKLYSVQIDPNEIPGIEAMGVPNYKSLTEVPEDRIDYAVSAVPRQVAPRILKDCIDNKVGSIGFFTSGFSETTEEIGIKLENDLRTLATASDIALVGPNCMGLYSPSVGLCNFPELKTGEAGDVCFISQSGTHSINFSTQAPLRGIKINFAASIGNVLMLEAADYLSLMADDPATKVIGMYVEGVRDGRRFFETLRRAAVRHPVVVWKGGNTEAGARATFSHTGSLATPATVWDSMVRQAGAVGAFGLDAMLDAVDLFARGRAVPGKGMGLVAMTGGQSVVITDTFAKAGLEIPTLSESSYEELKSFFNIIGGSYRNPMDAGGTIGGGTVHTGNLQRILEIMNRDPKIDAIVLEIGTGFAAQRWAAHEDELTGLLDKLAEFNNQISKPFVAIMHQAHVPAIVARGRELARERGLVVFESFDRAAAALRLSYDYWSMRNGRAN